MRRILQDLVAALGVSHREFSLKIQKSESYSRNIKNPTLEVARNILAAYPRVNPYFLINGDDPVFIENRDKIVNIVSEQTPQPTPQEINYRERCDYLSEENKRLRRENQTLRDDLLRQVAHHDRLMAEALQTLAGLVKKD